MTRISPLAHDPVHLTADLLDKVDVIVVLANRQIGTIHLCQPANAASIESNIVSGSVFGVERVHAERLQRVSPGSYRTVERLADDIARTGLV